MRWDFFFVINSVLLGVGLAADAFSVSMADGLGNPGMKPRKMCQIAGTFAGFQFAMPMTGWVCVHTVAQYFRFFQRLIPWIALFLLAFIGGKMLREGILHRKCAQSGRTDIGLGALTAQGVATSIDALSVGFTIAEYGFGMAFGAAVIIAAVTFILCLGGLWIGKKFGTRLSGEAQILGGAILIAIGIEIFVKGVAL